MTTSELCSLQFTRRQALIVGGLGTVGLSLPQLLHAESHSRTKGEKAIILVIPWGGPSQHDTFDPKPDAPAEVRGDLRPIASAAPGLLVGELMPRTARVTNHIAVLRAVQTNDNAHSSSGYYMTTY